MLRVVAPDGQITGYTAGVGWFTHTVGESNEDLKALIGSAAGIVAIRHMRASTDRAAAGLVQCGWRWWRSG
jgi:hypothetical protein